MKNKKLKTFAILAATLCGFISNTRAGTFQTITIDGNFTDWSSVPLLHADPQDSLVTTMDYGNIYAANDESYLYLRFSNFNVASNGFSSRQNLFVDADNNILTGYLPGGAGGGHLGSEMLIQGVSGFQEKNGGFNEGGITGLDLLRSPVGAGGEFEFRISRNATYTTGGQLVFANNTFAFVLESEDGPRTTFDYAPNTGALVYTFAVVPEPSSLSLLALGSAFATVGIVKRRAKAERAR
jgi:hypothetical protein